MEHRDGTGPACNPRLWRPDGKINTRPVFYYREDDIMYARKVLVWSHSLLTSWYSWEDNKLHDSLERPLPLRADQLAFRHQEIHIAYQAFCRFIQNDCTLELEGIDEVELNKQSWSRHSGKGPVCCTENVTLAGHSFGGCTMVCFCCRLMVFVITEIYSYPYFQQNPHQVMNLYPSPMHLF
jgi:platelet-activating factor acetylhydrolase